MAEDAAPTKNIVPDEGMRWTWRMAATTWTAIFGVLSVMFHIFGRVYYEGKLRGTLPPPLVDARAADLTWEMYPWFIVFSAVLCVGLSLVSFYARSIGHALAVLLGAAYIAAAFGAARSDQDMLLVITLVIIAALMFVLAYRSWKGDRVSWAFLTALMGVLAVIEFFGAPHVRDLTGLNLWQALIPCALLSTGCFALSRLNKNMA
jgi:hypothetical protein